MYVALCKQKKDGFCSVKGLLGAFKEVMTPKQSINKYYHDYKRKLDTEYHKFRGEICAGDGTDTHSEMTHDTGKKSSKREETEEVDSHGNPNDFEPNPLDRLDEEDELEEERLF
jgi:hypothetical protein